MIAVNVVAQTEGHHRNASVGRGKFEKEKNVSPATNTVSDRKEKQEEGCQLFG